MSTTAPAAPSAPTAPAKLQPLSGAALVLGTLSLSLATFMNVLDSSIANVSIPAISGDLGVSPNQGTWVITSFGVANAISVPLTGWLTQRFGAVRLFTSSIVLFVLSSWLCGFASSIEMLILFRVLQGLVAGPMIPLSQTLLLSSYPPAKAGMALALWGVTTLVAPVVGPLLGGWLTDNMTWPWIFYINVPVGLFAILLTPLVGKKVAVWDPRRMASGAFVVFAMVLYLRSEFTTQTDIYHILIPTLMQGAAMAFFFIPLTTIVLSGQPPERIPAAAGLSNFTRITAGAMGTSIATTVWEDRAVLHHAHLTESLNNGNSVYLSTLEGLKASGLTSEQALFQVNRLIDQQAFTRAADDVFFASGLIFLLLIGLIWFTSRPARHGAAPADAGGAH